MREAQSFQPQDIRNIVLVGQGGAGKTTLAEALLHRCGAITRMGSVESESTQSDFEPEAKSHHHSTSASVLFALHEGREINIIDTPGHPELIGAALSCLAAAETAVVVVDASAGVDFHTRRLYHAAGEAGLARMIVVNKIDQAPAGLSGLVDKLKSAFGSAVHCINLPTQGGRDVIDCFDHEAGESDFGDVTGIHREMLESAIEVDDAVLERYLSGEAIDLEELRRCFVKAMNAGHLVPVLFTAAKDEVGIDDLLHILVEEGPSPLSGRPRRVLRGDTMVEMACTVDAPLLAQVFKVASDPYAGRMAMLRIIQGRLDATSAFVAALDKKPRKAGSVLKVEGREHPELDAVAYAGDIVALAKIEDLHVDQILHAPGADDFAPALPHYPLPMLALAVSGATKNDDQKLGPALTKLSEEDPTLRSGQDPDTQEFVMRGLGDLHLRVALEKLKNRFNVNVETRTPTVAHHETITQKAEGHYRHKKQTGGAGQFAEVFLRVEPLPRGTGFEFASRVFGGAIPTHFIPAVEKGVLDAMEEGVVAGFPLQDVRVTVYDGKAHAVDSKEIAFRTAAKMAFKDAMARAQPVLLEPFVSLEISVPEAMTGNVMTDLQGMRGRIMGVIADADGTSVVHAQAPLAETRSYGAQLRGTTGGQGSFTMQHSHYDVMPAQLAERVVAERKAKRPS
jgi:elongation factor G